MANSDKDILITTNTGTVNEPKIEFTGADANGNDTITLTASYDGTVSTLSFDGSAGQLFSVSNIDSDGDGYLFAINDKSGIPSFQVETDGTVILNPNTGNVLVGTSTDDGTNVLQVAGNMKVTGTFNATGDHSYDDNVKAIFGAGSELQIYHDGTNSYIRHNSGTGELRLNTDTGVRIRKHDNETLAYFAVDGTASLHYDNDQKFRTSSSGIGLYSGNAIQNTGDHTITAPPTLYLDPYPHDNDSSGAVIIKGSLEVRGDVTSVSQQDLLIADNTITLNNGETGAGVTLGTAGIEIDRGTSANVSLLWDETNDAWEFYNPTRIAINNPATDPAQAAFELVTSENNSSTLTTLGVSYRQSSIKVRNANTTVGAYAALELRADDADAKIAVVAKSAAPNDADLAFIVDNTSLGSGVERMRIVGDTGDVGIGTTSPTFASGYSGLHINKDYSEIHLTNTNSGATASDGFKIQQNSSSNVFLWNYENAFLAIGTNNTERLRITSAGNVGIGTTSPATKLEVNGGTSGTDVDIASFTSTSGALNIRCSDLAAGNPTWTIRSFSGEPIAFAQATEERARIDSSGNLLIGQSSSIAPASDDTVGVAISPLGYISAHRTGVAAEFGRNNSDGDIAIFRKDGATVGSIGTVNDDLLVGTGDTGLRFHDTDNRIYPVNTSGGTKVDATIDLGDPTGRFKDLYLNGANLYSIDVDINNTTSNVFTFPTSLDGSDVTVTLTDPANERHIVKFLITHDGTTAVATQYGSVFTSSELASFTCDINAGNVRLRATTTTDIKFRGLATICLP